MQGLVNILTGKRGIDPMLCFGLFAIGIGQFADKMSGIAAFMPSFGDVGTDGSR